MYDDIADDVARLVDGGAGKFRLQVYRRDEDRFCTFTVEYDAETAIGVNIGHNHLLATDAETGESMLVSGREAKYGCSVIAFEDLTDIRERTGTSWGHKWAFNRLYESVEDKAAEYGIATDQTDPENTARRCST